MQQSAQQQRSCRTVPQIRNRKRESMTSRPSRISPGKVARHGLNLAAGLATLAFTAGAGPLGLSQASQQPPSKAGRQLEALDREAEADHPYHEVRKSASDPVVISISEATSPKWLMLCQTQVDQRQPDKLPKKCRGTASLTLRPDGSWNFSGAYAWSEPRSHMQFVLGLKDSGGSLFLFTADSPSSMAGYVWSKHGQSRTIRDNWAAFSKGYEWYWKCRFETCNGSNLKSSAPDFGSIFEDIAKAMGTANGAAAAVL
jgi:hypothetical protein